MNLLHHLFINYLGDKTMIEFTCKAKDLVEKLETLAKAKLFVSKNYYNVNCRILKTQCELCVNMKAHNNNHYKYSDYYAYIDVDNCAGQGQFGIPHAFDLLPAFKTLDKNDVVTFNYDKDTLKIMCKDDVIYNDWSSEPDDSYIKILDTFVCERMIDVSSVFIDYISNLLKVIPPTKDLKDTHFNSIVFDKHPLQSNSLLLLRTDSMRLMYYDFSMETAWPFGRIVVPRDAIAWLTKLKKKRSENVIVKQHGYYISFEYDDYRMICGITKEFPPAVHDFIKLGVDYFSGFATKALLQDIQYVTMGNGDKPVTIKAKQQQAEIVSDDNLRKRRMNCAIDSDKELDLTVYASQLTSLLNVCGSQVYIYQLSGLTNIYRITSPDKNFNYIIRGFDTQK
jgi:hypothetical protein